MKLIIENWRRFSDLDHLLLLEKQNLAGINLPKAAEIAKNNPDEEDIQRRLASGLLASHPDVEKLISIITKVLKPAQQQASKQTSPQEKDELASAGIEEGIGDVWASLQVAALQGASGNFADALSSVGLDKLAKANPKVWGAAILAIGALGAASGAIESTDAAKMATLAAKVGTGGINSMNLQDLEDVIAATSGIDGGKVAEE